MQAQVLRGEHAAARATLAEALVEYPASIDLRRAQAGELHRFGRNTDAESLLRDLLADNPRDAASAFNLADLLADQGRPSSSAQALRECFAASTGDDDPELAIRAIEQLDALDEKANAAAIAQLAIARHPDDSRLHAYAGMLEIQLGNFGQAREHYLFALGHDARAWEWHAPLGLSSAQRYVDDGHPDFQLFRDGLRRPDLSGLARAELCFALGKAFDDIGDYPQAAQQFRDGNAIARRLTNWSRKPWRRAVEARLSAAPVNPALEPSIDFTPVFIVGMPRTGTTLLAELLSRHPATRNRGELPWLAQLAQRPSLAGTPGHAALQAAAAEYVRRARRDDAGNARWFIDKQPLNFRYLDLALALFPDARVIHCQRHARDTALSLWMQCFLEDVQGYSYDFDDILLVMRDEQRLMAHWDQSFPGAIRTVRYEDLVSDPDAVTGTLAQWIGLPPIGAADASSPQVATGIGSASLWQARQPVHTRSRGRWTRYASLVPELSRFPDG